MERQAFADLEAGKFDLLCAGDHEPIVGHHARRARRVRVPHRRRERHPGRAARARCGGTGKLYRSADLFVIPTLSDGFAITQLEAMAHGLPVIATPHCAEVIAELARMGVSYQSEILSRWRASSNNWWPTDSDPRRCRKEPAKRLISFRLIRISTKARPAAA